jgi:hypothetical protein
MVIACPIALADCLAQQLQHPQFFHYRY